MDKNFVVYYELPPMRAIFHRTVVAKDRMEAETRLKEQLQMNPKIRNVVEQ